LVVRTPQTFREKQDIDARIRHEVIAVEPAQGRVRVRRLDAHKESREAFDHLVIACGAVPICPDMEGAGAEGIFGVNTLQSGIVVRKVVDEQKP
jgi:NADPH-dependent 2,4-dienoyl-CoA reductase/sulfur reductase-like enzyme